MENVTKLGLQICLFTTYEQVSLSRIYINLYVQQHVRVLEINLKVRSRPSNQLLSFRWIYLYQTASEEIRMSWLKEMCHGDESPHSREDYLNVSSVHCTVKHYAVWPYGSLAKLQLNFYIDVSRIVAYILDLVW